MELTKIVSILLAALCLSVMASVSQAAHITIYGNIENGTGALASLVPPGTGFTGELEWTAGELVGGQVLLGGLCFTDDASGANPITSPTCGALGPVPIFANGQTAYDPAGNVGPYQQAGSTFDGVSGTIELQTFSPAFGLNIPITLSFTSLGMYGGNGTVFADAGVLGTACGGFGDGSCEVIPIPAAAWLFGSALIGLVGIGRKRRA